MPVSFSSEEQQKQLQSSVNLLSPAGEDLAEIKQQEQQIVSLLNEQRRQESELQRMHLLQQQRLEEQSNSFTHERKVCLSETTKTVNTRIVSGMFIVLAKERKQMQDE